MMASKGLATRERLDCLMWDEMAVTKDLRFDTKTLKWKCIVDYEGEVSIMVPNGVADHVLVLVFRSFLGGWVQPFA